MTERTNDLISYALLVVFTILMSMLFIGLGWKVFSFVLIMNFIIFWVICGDGLIKTINQKD